MNVDFVNTAEVVKSANLSYKLVEVIISIGHATYIY